MDKLPIEKIIEDLIGGLPAIEIDDEGQILPVALNEIFPDFWDEWFNPILEVWAPDVRHTLLEVFLDSMQFHRDRLASRYVALAFYSGFIQFLTSRHWLKSVPEDFSEFHDNGKLYPTAKGESVVAELTQDCHTLLRSVTIADITTWREIRWEISNSALTEDWERSVQLYERAGKLELVGTGDWTLLVGQFQFLLAFSEAPPGPLQNEVLKANPWRLRTSPFWWAEDYGRVFHPGNWEPRLYESVDSVASLLLYAGAVDISIVGPEDCMPDRKALRCAVDALEEAKKYSLMRAPYQALLARCLFGAGRFHEAATQYELALTEKVAGAFSKFRPHIYRALATCFVSASEPNMAIEALQRCSSEFPDESDIYIRTAALQAELSDYRSAQQTLRMAKDESPGVGEDWRISIILALTEVQASEGSSDLRVDSDERNKIVSFLNEYWPPFSGLSKTAQDQWVEGEFLSHCLLKYEDMSKALILKGRANFALALEIELREKVFMPVRQHFRERAELYALINEEALKSEKSRNKDVVPFCDFVKKPNSKFTLGFGDMVLRFCRQNSAPPLFVELREWIAHRFPRLLTNADLISGIPKFRNDVFHANEAKSAFADANIPNRCRQLIEMIQDETPASTQSL